MSNVILLYVDLFCGAGGTSTGVERARLFGEQCAIPLSVHRRSRRNSSVMPLR